MRSRRKEVVTRQFVRLLSVFITKEADFFYTVKPNLIYDTKGVKVGRLNKNEFIFGFESMSESCGWEKNE